MQTVLLLLKLLGVTVSGAFGVLGTVYESRDKDGRLSRWGRVSVTGTLLGVVIAISAQLIESHLQQKSATQAAEQTLDETRKLAKIVTNLDRNLQPIDSISMFVFFSVTDEDPSIQGYLRRARAAVEEYLKQNLDAQAHDPRMRISLTDWQNGQQVPVQVNIPSSSPIFPQRDKEPVANGLLAIDSITLSFYKKPIEASRFPIVRGTKDDPDLQVDLFNRNKLSLDQNVKSNSFSLMGGLESDKRSWNNKSGEIISLPDLAGAQLFITISPFAINLGITSKDVVQNAAFLKARSELRIDDLNLKFGTRSIWMHANDFKKFSDSDGGTVWEFDFPKDYSTFFSGRYAFK